MRKNVWRSAAHAVLFVAATLAVLGAAAVAAEEAKRWSTNSENVVLDGYDVVAYHAVDRAVRGRAEHAATHDGATFFFSSRANREAFTENPERYAPRFGGYCAFGVAAQKAKVPADPRTFKFYQGGLLVFYNDLYKGEPVNTKVMWNENEKALFVQAATAWKTLE